jgi:outer membrane protein OmpA-like peptidoglycan-associated protein
VSPGLGSRATYGLVGFKYNSSELGGASADAVRDIAATVERGATIEVLGYTDRIGNDKHNTGLSLERAQMVARALRSQLDARGVKDVEIEAHGEGIETGRFENDLPEGRMLSRGVSVTVEQMSTNKEK